MARSAPGRAPGRWPGRCPHARTRSCSWTWVLLSISFHEHVVVTSSSTSTTGRQHTRPAHAVVCARLRRAGADRGTAISGRRGDCGTRRLRPDVGSVLVRTYHLARYSTPREGRRYAYGFHRLKHPRPRPGTRERARAGGGPAGRTRPPTARTRGRPETFLMIFRTRHLYELCLWICTIVYTGRARGPTKLGGIA